MTTLSILFVDQVESTSQLSQLGDRSAVRLRDELQSLALEHLNVFSGRFVRDTGDGLMATFDSCVNAADFALSVHEALAERNVARPPEERLVLRMGLHTGEPLDEESGPFGASVVVAARLCALAGAGQVLISDVVRALLEPRRSYVLNLVGARRLKGFPEPVVCHLLLRPMSERSTYPVLLASRDAPFVGRAAELDRLRVAYLDAAESGVGVLVVAGDRGVGKTRLIQEFAAEVDQQGGHVLYAVGGDGVGLVSTHLAGSPGEQSTVTLGVVDDVVDESTIASIVDLLGVDRPDGVAGLFVVVATELTGLGEGVAGFPVLHLTGFTRADVENLMDVHVEPLDAPVSVGALHMRSGGSPGALNAELDTLGRQTLRSRVRQAIDAAATGRDEHDRAIAAATSGLLALAAPSQAGGPAGEVAPYKGLVAYDADDGRWFCGRDRPKAELVASLSITRFLAVTGSSGSGKSSLVNAGLIADLQSDAIDGSASWPIIMLTPHAMPLAELATCLVTYSHGDSAAVLAGRLRSRPTLLADIATRMMDDHSPADRLLLVVDQFEEAFTQCRDDDERVAFFDALVHAAQVVDGPTTVVVVLRGDYYGHCAVHPELARLLAASHHLVGPMSASEIRAAIEEPAHRAGLSVDGDLIDRAVDESTGAPGVLPLLSTAMLETWNRREGNRLTVEAYIASGGVHGAIARLAESVYERLSADERAALRALLLRLAELGEDGDDVRRRATLDEVVMSPTHERVLDALVTHRLVTVDADRVEVAHEALLREWPRLRSWLEEDRAGRQLHRSLATDARAWDAASRPNDQLYRGVRLEAAVEWSAQHREELHPVEQAYLETGTAAWQLELANARRTARRLRVLAVSLAVLLALAVAAGVLALNQRDEAQTRASVAEATRIAQLSGLALDGQDLETAALLAVEGWRAHQTDATEGALLSAAQEYGSSSQVLPIFIDSSDVSSDDVIASPGIDSGGVSLWDLSRREAIGTIDTTSASSVQFSPDGTRLAVLTNDDDDDETLRLEFWDVATRELISTFELGPANTAEFGLHFPLAWLPDGTRAVVAGDDRTRVLDVATETEIDTLPPAQTAMITRDGQFLVLADDAAIHLWDPISLDDLGELATIDGDAGFPPTLAQGPDDLLLAVVDDGLQAWRLSTRAPVELDVAEFAFGLAVSQDGRLAMIDGNVWDLTTWRPVAVLETGDSYSIPPGHFNADGSFFITPTPHSPSQILPVEPIAGRITSLGRFAANVVGVIAGEERITVLGQGDPADVDETTFDAAVVDPAKPALLQTTALGTGRSAAVSRDGRVVAVRARPEDEVAVRFFDVVDGIPLASVPADGDVASVDGSIAVTDDGRHAALLRGSGTVMIVETATGQEVASIPTASEDHTVLAFTPEGHLAVVTTDGSNTSTASIWDLDARPVGKPVEVGAGANVSGVAANVDGDVLMVAGDDGVVEISLPAMDVIGRLPPTYAFAGFHPSDAGPGRVAMPAGAGLQIWNLSNRLPIRAELYGAAGATLAIGDEMGQPTLYGFSAPGGELFMTKRTLDPAEIVVELCSRVGHNLTPEQWAQYFPGDRYQETCPLDE